MLANASNAPASALHAHVACRRQAAQLAGLEEQQAAAASSARSSATAEAAGQALLMRLKADEQAAQRQLEGQLAALQAVSARLQASVLAWHEACCCAQSRRQQ